MEGEFVKGILAIVGYSFAVLIVLEQLFVALRCLREQGLDDALDTLSDTSLGALDHVDLSPGGMVDDLLARFILLLLFRFFVAVIAVVEVVQNVQHTLVLVPSAPSREFEVFVLLLFRVRDALPSHSIDPTSDAAAGSFVVCLHDLLESEAPDAPDVRGTGFEADGVGVGIGIGIGVEHEIAPVA